MAFDVTPTSGEGPYEFTANISNKIAFEHGYVLKFTRSAQSVGVCPDPAAADIEVPEAIAPLLASGVYTRNSVVAENVCMVFGLSILDPLGIEMETQYVTVSNVE